MAKKTVQKEDFTVEKGAFQGPFNCHGKTALLRREMHIDGNTFSYMVWSCRKCKKDYLDSSQAKRMELLWAVEKLLKNEEGIKRSINHDGKMFFLRFPKEFTRGWKKGNEAEIIPVDSTTFIVEIG
ncbi:hypothetical protein GOV09_02915 [Candidatus Woesearchaeota archaeon]|nr:hypothetical protein [Candidatus Woesearchaeota archaeon]